MERLWFCEKSRWQGIWQFEHEVTPKQRELLKSLSKNVKCGEQILIHRERKEGMAHYVYALRLDDGNWLYLYLPSHWLFTDFSKLFWFFREVVCLLDERGILVTGCKASVNTKTYLRNTKSKSTDYGKLAVELEILNNNTLCKGLEELPKDNLPTEDCGKSESHDYIDRDIESVSGQEVVELLRQGYYNFIIRKNDKLLDANELRNKLTERRAPKAHVSTNGIESALDYNQKLKEQERKIAELEAEIKRQRRTKNDTLNSILGALKFTPSKHSGVIKAHRRLTLLNRKKKEKIMKFPITLSRGWNYLKSDEFRGVFWLVLFILGLLYCVITPWLYYQRIYLFNVPIMTLCLSSFYFAIKAQENSKKEIILSFIFLLAWILSVCTTVLGQIGLFQNDETVENTLPYSEPTSIADSITVVQPTMKIQIKSHPDFVLIPAGQLHNVPGQSQKYYDIDSFYVSKYELTQQEYKRVIGKITERNYIYLTATVGPIDTHIIPSIKLQQDSLPVVGTYTDFAQYCNERSIQEGYDGYYVVEKNKVSIKKDGNGYRLLSPFEWIFAAKGGNANDTYKFVGSDTIRKVAWYGGNSKGKPHPVGKLEANSLGIYDMAGNVREMLEGKTKYGTQLEGGSDFVLYLQNEVQFGPYDISSWYTFAVGHGVGTRICFVPRGMKNKNLELRYKHIEY